VLVDEYQDTNFAQGMLLRLLVEEHRNVTVVGDDDQAIYRFRGASQKNLRDFEREFPDATVVRLERDYRSTPEVVSLANRVIGAARDRPAGSRLKLVGQRQAGPPPRFGEYDDEPAEAAAVARRIKDLVDNGVSASEIAVLFRVNAQSEVYEQALSEAGVPYLLRGGERFFSRPEVRQAMITLRQAAGNGVAGGDLPGTVRDVLSPLGLSSEPPTGGAARQKWESLLALVELAEELTASVPDADLPQYVAELEQRADTQHPPTVEGVTLASLHAAKGLEWDAVFLVGLVEGTLPIQHADSDAAAVEEERRLLYVGVTRAREHLWLSWALARAAGGRRGRRRSRFLYGLIPDDHPTARLAKSAPRETRRDDTPPKCRICGTTLVGTLPVKLGRCADCPSDVDEELLARLRAWRSDQARMLKVPPYVVFTDATLVAIAEQRPSDSAGMVAISGIGAAKLDRYGSDVLALVRAAPAVTP
jgi:DNA helicase-2/ATP-dependent DNA helicase PcrA